MGTIVKPNTFSPNTTISASDVNANFDTVYNEFNGSVSAANLAADSVTTVKIADTNVTTAKLADSAVTAAKINFGGAGAGVWWQEIARTTLSGAGDTITVSSIPARKYLMVIIEVVSTGGTVNTSITFNGDTGANYAFRVSTDGAADSSATSTTSINTVSTASATPIFAVANVRNIAAQEKLVYAYSIGQNTAGAANLPIRRELAGKWANTAAQITTVTVTNTGTGDYAIGSEVVVLGHD